VSSPVIAIAPSKPDSSVVSGFSGIVSSLFAAVATGAAVFAAVAVAVASVATTVTVDANVDVGAAVGVDAAGLAPPSDALSLVTLSVASG